MNYKKVFIIIMLLVPIVSLFSSQRVVLIESFVKTTCPYCPYAARAIKQLANETGDSLVPIEYHLNDPFSNGYANTRAGYYGVSGTPTTWVDGVYQYVGGGNSNYNQYRSAFNARKGLSSPFDINLSGTYSPQSHTGNITAEIIATGNPPSSNLHLRYAIVETDIPYHWQTEDSVYFVERAMFPSASGVSISMSQGDTLYDNRNFTFNTSWNFLNSYILVFIQDDSDKEIQQAARWTIPITIPNISYVGSDIDDSSGGNNDHRADPGESVNMIVSLYNCPPFKDATNVSATISNNDPDITITHSSANFPDIPAGSTVNNSADPFSFSVSSSASVHRTKFIMNISAQPNNYTTTDTFEIMIGRPAIIFVDNDGGDAYGNVEDFFSSAIESLGIVYDMVTDSSVEMQYLDDYQVVVWFTGALNTNTVPTNAQTLLENFLDGGGKLFITGQDIGHDIGSSSFYTNYLHAIFKTDNANYWGIIGVSNDPIGNGLALTITGGSGANNQSSPSAISKKSESDSCFVYPGSIGVSAVRYSGTYKTVYFSFGFEAINDESKRIEVLRRILEWFGLISGIEENPVFSVDGRPTVSIFPNPFVKRVNIRYSSVDRGQEPVLKIYDLAGKLVRQLSIHSGNTVWNGTDSNGKPLPVGIYFCKVINGDTVVKTEKLMMLK